MCFSHFHLTVCLAAPNQSSTNKHFTWHGYTTDHFLAFAVSSTTSSCKFKVVLSNGASGTSSTNNTYSRTTAKTYMTNHYATGTFNANYPDFTGSGGDCTNFASQVVKAGGTGHLGNFSNRDAITPWFCTSLSLIPL